MCAVPCVLYHVCCTMCAVPCVLYHVCCTMCAVPCVLYHMCCIINVCCIINDVSAGARSVVISGSADVTDMGKGGVKRACVE